MSYLATCLKMLHKLTSTGNILYSHLRLINIESESFYFINLSLDPNLLFFYIKTHTHKPQGKNSTKLCRVLKGQGNRQN